MTSSNHDAPSKPPPSLTPALSSLRFPKTRASDVQSLASSVSSLPYRPSNASASSVFASTATPPGSRSITPSGVRPGSGLAASLFVGTPTDAPQQLLPAASADDPRNILVQAYVPHIAVLTSSDTKDLSRDKGFANGLWELLRPFGEQIMGKVTIRDSVGASRTCEDFAVRFIQLGDGLESPRSADPSQKQGPTLKALRTGGNIEQIESVVEKHLAYAESSTERGAQDYLNFKDSYSPDPTGTSPFYSLFLRRVLSGLPLAPHETFAHPVACIIAISSRNPSPIEALRHLYNVSVTSGGKRLPLWINVEYLRYYVLVHDEERDDISKSMALFEQMKRHFGLHCHLLRLRSAQCVLTDDDSVPLPTCQWISAAEELANIKKLEEDEDFEDNSPCIFESDITAIKTFIREMVTQSIIPFMERNVSTWNDQVASRRRGISGRLVNLSKRWTGFGAVARTSSSSNSSGTSNYDPMQGFYRPDAPEAVMRKLADYAFMLRDWKLALSTYELLRSDYQNDKAWRYQAAANEMAAISSLLHTQSMSSKQRAETVDQMLETAYYSYITRCGASYEALRAMTLGSELLRVRGGSATDDAARWGWRLLEAKIIGSTGEALIKERIAVCFASRRGVGSGHWGHRTRKAALWNTLAAESWLNLGKYIQANRRLAEARRLYASLPHKNALSSFDSANEFLNNLEREIQVGLAPANGESQVIMQDEVEEEVEEESESLGGHRHRKSLVGALQPSLASLETSPLNTRRGSTATALGSAVSLRERKDDFE